MNSVMKNKSLLSSVLNRPSLMLAGKLCLLMILLFLLGSSATMKTASASTSHVKLVSGYPIKVYFPKTPDTFPGKQPYVFPVERVSPTKAVATYALQLLIAGPTLEEQEKGYYSDLNGILRGSSTCGGPDFRLLLDRKGNIAEAGVATVQFCRELYGPGHFGDDIVKEQISKTLQQFPNIKKVLVLMKNGQCWEDEVYVRVEDYCVYRRP